MAKEILLFEQVIAFLHNAAVVAPEGFEITNTVSDFVVIEICDLKRPANQNNHCLQMTKHRH